MVSEAGEPECLARQAVILPRIVGAVSGANATVVMPPAILASADDAPGREATKALAHATIHPAVTGTAAAGRELFVTAARPSVGACRATDWANSIAAN
ncbi:MAG TPA: hypothetical protein VG187_17875 [Mycobacterium sp.]|nr:hypothetical protein [Mycobacterium sp.]